MKISPLKFSHQNKAYESMLSCGVSLEGANILAPKAIALAFKIDNIKSWEANILKQHLLSLGTDAAIERSALVKNIKTSAIIFGNLSQLRQLCEKIKNQPFNLREISQTISTYIDNIFKSEFNFVAAGKNVKIDKPLICGIINLTPDSFSGDGLLKSQNSKGKSQNLILEKAQEMVTAGAKMLDLGGESSRPYATSVSAKEEIARVIPALKVIRKEFKKVLISVDTYKYEVACAAADIGVDIINDITSLRFSPKISSLIKKYKLGCVLMHMQGAPQTMQIKPRYDNVSEDIADFFQERLEFLNRVGVDCKQIIIDPGIGFGKTVENNLKLINELYKFKIFGLPILIGLSRKTFIGKILNLDVGERLAGTISANTIALLGGANILRVHDVQEAVWTEKIVSAVVNS